VRIGLGLLAFTILLALTACGGGSAVSVPGDIPANFNSILSGLKSAVTETQNDLGGEHTDALMGASNQAGACVNLVANVDYDVTTTIDHDRQNVIGEVNDLQGAIAVVRQDITDWKNDVQAIINQGYRPQTAKLRLSHRRASRFSWRSVPPTVISIWRIPTSTRLTAWLMPCLQAHARDMDQEPSPARSVILAKMLPLQPFVIPPGRPNHFAGPTLTIVSCVGPWTVS